MLKRAHIRILLGVILMALMMTGCKSHDISITSCSLVSVKMSGLKSVDAVLSLGVHNPKIFSFKATDIHGDIRIDGKDIALFTAEDVDIARKSDDSYEIPVELTLAEGQNLMRLMIKIPTLDLSTVTMDVYVTGKLRSGISVKKSFKDIKLSELVN